MRFLLFTILLLQIGMSSSAQDMTHLFLDRSMMSVSQSELEEAITLTDIHSRYNTDWVATYISTKITVSKNGKSVSAAGANHQLNKEQKNILENAAVGSEVQLKVSYLPKNNLSHNTVKEMNYSYKVVPAVSAQFPEGEEVQKSYIHNSLIAKLDAEQIDFLRIGQIDFAISTTGEIVDVTVFKSSGDEVIDAILVNAIREMPQWKPALKSDGTRVKQPIEFYISNNRSLCLLPVQVHN